MEEAPLANAETEAALRAAAEAGKWSEVATLALTAYGEEILGYLVALTRDQVNADESFSIFLENMWRALPSFGWRSSFRTWAYVIARNAAHRLARNPARRRGVPIDSSIEPIVARLRSQTASYLQTANRDRVSVLRATLSADDQTLLILRINRGLAWRDIAQVMAIESADVETVDPATAPALPDEELTRRAAALRKRFMRLKDDLRMRLKSEE
jgi:RNA polymerase sigma-70 factor, ECF subfamily